YSPSLCRARLARACPTIDTYCIRALSYNKFSPSHFQTYTILS
ncbi:hypothetical protein HMPREF6123_1415, partial [Oribacterium sinus F0268]